MRNEGLPMPFIEKRFTVGVAPLAWRPTQYSPQAVAN
jgi:hypothetical protein